MSTKPSYMKQQAKGDRDTTNTSITNDQALRKVAQDS